MKGDSFGEQSLYYNTMRQLSVKADEESTLLILPRDTLYKIMGEDIYQVTFKNFIKWSLESNNLLQNLKKAEIDSIIQKMKLSSYKVNETIFRKGVSGFQKLVVVIEGQLKNTRTGVIIASKGQCFGD
jgi:cGMP-dependent protein kinase